MSVVATYIVWWVVISKFSINPVLMTPVLMLLLAFHTSLVHELLHGHPTRSQWFNDLLGTPPVALIYPYAVFKDTHLRHHRNDHLTIPGVDPESFFHCSEDWNKKPKFLRIVAWINMALAGRLLLSPMFSVIQMLKLCMVQLFSGTLKQKLTWLIHIPAVIGVLYVATNYYAVPLWIYLLSAYGAHSLISLRSFFEHRTSEDPDQRIVIVRSCWFFKLLFLNNNFHATHHRYPYLPWYKIENRFNKDGGTVLKRNGNFYFSGYRDWLQFLFHPVASPVYPYPVKHYTALEFK